MAPLAPPGYAYGVDSHEKSTVDPSLENNLPTPLNPRKGEVRRIWTS